MSAEWPDLLVGLSTYPALFNDRHLVEIGNSISKDSHIVLMQTELYQDKSQAVIVRTKQRGLNNFFSFGRFYERLFGIANPIINLRHNLLTVVYKSDQSFWHSFSRYVKKYLRHIVVDVVTFIVLPMLALIDIVKYKFWDQLTDKKEWTADRLLFILFKLIKDTLSIPFIIAFEYIRHMVSLVISLIMIIGTIMFPIIGYGIRQLFNVEKPASTNEINKDAIAVCLNEIQREVKRYTAATIANIGDNERQQAALDWKIQVSDYVKKFKESNQIQSLVDKPLQKAFLKQTFSEQQNSDLSDENIVKFNNLVGCSKAEAIEAFQNLVDGSLNDVENAYLEGNIENLSYDDALKKYFLEGFVRVSLVQKSSLFSANDEKRKELDEILSDRTVLEAQIGKI